MAIAFDATTPGGSGVASYAHTCTGSNGLLIIGLTNPGGNISGITYGGVALTKLVAQNQGSLWYLLNPSTGSNSVVLTGGGSSDFSSSAVSYTGVSQTSFPDSSAASNAASGSAFSTTVVLSGCWLISVSSLAGNTTISSNRTDRQTYHATNSPFTQFTGGISDSNGTVGTGSQSITITSGSSNALDVIVASFAPVGGGGSSANNLTLLGVG